VPPTATNSPAPRPPTATAILPLNSTPSAMALSAEERRLSDLIDSERVRAGLPPALLDAALMLVARERSQDMLARHYFSHNDPLSQTPLAPRLLHQHGLDIFWGEALFTSGSPQPAVGDEAMRAFMGDPAHRDIVLGPTWTAKGIGVASGAAVIITVLFGVK